MAGNESGEDGVEGYYTRPFEIRNLDQEQAFISVI